MMRRKQMVAVFTALSIGVMTLTGCGTSSDTVKIGATFDLSGLAAQYGIAASNGIKLAIEEYNAEGGVLDKQIELKLVDNKANQVDAANAAKKLIESDKVAAILGSDISSTSLTIAEIAEEKNIPMITPTGTAYDITQTGDSVFRACYIDPDQGNMIAKFATEELQVKKAALMINSESDYSLGVAEAFKKTFEQSGGEVVETVTYGGSDVDFRPILANIKNTEADIVVIPDYYEMVANIAPQAREIGITATFLGGDGWDGVLNNVANNPESVEGSYFINHYALEDESTLVQDFISNYQETYDETPNAFAALGYDATRVLIEAIDTAGSTDAVAITEALAATNLECVTGKITFDAFRNPIKPVSIIQIKDGANVLHKKIDIERVYE